MAFQKETDSVTSRDFSATGFMGKLADFLEADIVDGGAGWTMLDDRRLETLDPYIVVTNMAGATWSSRAKVVQIQMMSATERIRVRYYLWWDVASHTGVFEWHRGVLTTQTGSFVYDFRGGEEILFIASRIGATNYWSGIDDWEGITTFGLPNTTISALAAKPFLESGDGAGYLSGYHNITNFKTALETDGKLRFRLVNTTGSTYRIDIFKDAARTIRVGFTGTFTNTTVGAKGINAEPGYTIGGSVTTDITVAANDTIDCQFLRLHLGAGEGANFAEGKNYFMFDFSTNVARVRYFKVEEVDADELKIDGISATDFPAGTLVGAYPHRYQALSSHYFENFGLFHSLPYMAAQGSETQTKDGSNDTRADWAYYTGVTDMSPDHEGRYPMMRPVIKETNLENLSVTGLAKRNHGKPKNLMISSQVGLLEFSFGRELNGEHWMPFHFAASSLAYLIRDDVSLS